MKYDVYINTSVSVYDVEAKTEKEAQSKALKLMLKQIVCWLPYLVWLSQNLRLDIFKPEVRKLYRLPARLRWAFQTDQMFQ